MAADFMDRRSIECTINGRSISRSVRANRTLVEFIRDELGLTGTTEGCGVGVCGCCTVLVDGEPVNSCLELAVNADGTTVTTIEGLRSDGELSSVQQSFKEHEGFQCGYCTPGMVMMTRALLDEYPNPNEDFVREYLSENLCRCTGYTSIIEAIEAARTATGAAVDRNDEY